MPCLSVPLCWQSLSSQNPQFTHTKVWMTKNICWTALRKVTDLFSGMKYWAEKIVGTGSSWRNYSDCAVFACSLECSPEFGWLTGPRGEVSSAAEGACWGSLWGLSDILKGNLSLSLGPFRNVCQLFHFFKPHFSFMTVGFESCYALDTSCSLLNSCPHILLLVWIYIFFYQYPIHIFLLTCPLYFSHKGLDSRLKAFH